MQCKRRRANGTTLPRVPGAPTGPPYQGGRYTAARAPGGPAGTRSARRLGRVLEDTRQPVLETPVRLLGRREALGHLGEGGPDAGELLGDLALDGLRPGPDHRSVVGLRQLPGITHLGSLGDGRRCETGGVIELGD